MCGATILLRMGYADAFCGGFLNDFSWTTWFRVLKRGIITIVSKLLASQRDETQCKYSKQRYVQL